MKKAARAAALVLTCATVPVSAQDFKPDTKMQETLGPKEKKAEEKKPKQKKAEEKKSEKEKPEEKKSEEKKPEEKSPWDIAFGSALMSDYIFRGITQSNHRPSLTAYFEPRLDLTNSLQAFFGIEAESISFPNRAAAEIDFYAGFRPTFGRLALEYGFWEYWYPGGRCFNDLAVGGPECAAQGPLPNGNVEEADLSYWEIYAKGTYTFNDQFSVGGNVYWSPSVANSGAKGTYIAGTAKYILPIVFLNDIGWFISANVGHWFLGTTDSFYCTQNDAGFCAPPFPNGIPYKSYTNWDIGIAFTWKQFTLDFRYSDTNLNKGDCNAFTSDFTARFDGSFTPINPRGIGSTWCGPAFIAKLSVDLTKDNLK